MNNLHDLSQSKNEKQDHSEREKTFPVINGLAKTMKRQMIDLDAMGTLERMEYLEKLSIGDIRDTKTFFAYLEFQYGAYMDRVPDYSLSGDLASRFLDEGEYDFVMKYVEKFGDFHYADVERLIEQGYASSLWEHRRYFYGGFNIKSLDAFIEEGLADEIAVEPKMFADWNAEQATKLLRGIIEYGGENYREAVALLKTFQPNYRTWDPGLLKLLQERGYTKKDLR